MDILNASNVFLCKKDMFSYPLLDLLYIQEL